MSWLNNKGCYNVLNHKGVVVIKLLKDVVPVKPQKDVVPIKPQSDVPIKSQKDVVPIKPQSDVPLNHRMMLYQLNHRTGAGIAQWLERQTHDWKVAGLNPCRSGGRIFFSRSTFCADSYFRIRSTRVLLQ